MWQKITLFALSVNAAVASDAGATTLNPIVVKGNFLYDAVTQMRFFAKGIDYNPQPYTYNGNSQACSAGQPKFGPFQWGTDLISDDLEALWDEDLDAMAELGANTIRIYDVDPQQSHEKFMTKAARLGMYVIIPLTRASWGFLPADLPAPQCYVSNITGYGTVGTNLVASAKMIVKQFSKFNNTLMFTVGNEVETSHRMGFAALPCVKALTRDIHQFQTECAAGMRRIPLLYAATDVGGDTRRLIAEYMTCDLHAETASEGASDAVDVYGLNVYSWCDETYPDENGVDNFEWSPYSQIMKDMGGFAKPMIFAEFGCNIGKFATSCPYPGGRTWPQVKHIVGSMAELLSGALAYEYSMESAQESNQYGIVLKPGYLAGQDKLVKLDQFYALQQAFKNATIHRRWDGGWTDSDRCSWNPATGPWKLPKFKSSNFKRKHVPSTCPSIGPLTKLFTDHYSDDQPPNWLNVLATAPGPVTLECPSYDLGPVILAENQCAVHGALPLGSGPKKAASVNSIGAAESRAELESRVVVDPASTKNLTASFLIENLWFANLSDSDRARLSAVYASGIHHRVYEEQWEPMDVSRWVRLDVGVGANSTTLLAMVPLLPGRNMSEVEQLLGGAICLDFMTATTEAMSGTSAITGAVNVTLVNVEVAEEGASLWGPQSAQPGTLNWRNPVLWQIIGLSIAVLACAAVGVMSLYGRPKNKKVSRAARVQAPEPAPGFDHSAPLVQQRLVAPAAASFAPVSHQVVLPVAAQSVPVVYSSQVAHHSAYGVTSSTYSFPAQYQALPQGSPVQAASYAQVPLYRGPQSA